MAKLNPAWITDEYIDVAIYIPPTGLKVRETGNEKGYVWVELDDMVIYSCYVSPTIKEEELQAYLNKVRCSIEQRGENKKNVLIGGDFNAKAYSWGSPIEDKKGSILAEWINENDYNILNDGQVPTFERNNGSSYIDVTICSTEIGKLVRNWYVDEEENLSYHKNIYIELQKQCFRQTKKSKNQMKGWRYNKEQKDALLIKVDQEKGRLSTSYDANKLKQLMETACNHALSKKHGYFKHKAAYWWNDNIAQLRRKSTEARRKVTRGNRQNINEHEKHEIQNRYRECRKALKDAIKLAKKSAWDQLCTAIDADTWGLGYKIVTGKMGARSPLQATDKEQQKIAKTLFPEHKIKLWPMLEVSRKEIPLCDNKEILEASDRIKSGKAAGPDGIPPEVIKAIAEHRPDVFVKIINGLLLEGNFPIDGKLLDLY